MKLRLHQFLSRAGVFASKRDAKEAVWAGEITVAESVVKDIAFQFNPNTKPVHYKGRQLHLPSDHRTFLLNKPVGVVCSRLNKHERSLGKVSVFELLREGLSDRDFSRLVTVGRLDEFTTGLLLLTTDGHLVHRLASPEANIEKTYLVRTEHDVDPQALKTLRQGVDIELETNGDVEVYTTEAATVDRIKSNEFILSISEGKKRQVRRMFASLGHSVVALERVSIGSLSMDMFDLNYGEYVDLTDINLTALVEG